MPGSFPRTFRPAESCDWRRLLLWGCDCCRIVSSDGARRVAAGGSRHRHKISIRCEGGNTPGQESGTSPKGLVVIARHGVCKYFLSTIIRSDHLCSLRQINSQIQMSIVHKLESVEAFKLAHTMPPYSHLCQPVSVPRAPANPTQIAVDKSTSTPRP